MWFVFPQLVGLGQSAMSRRFSLTSIEDARRYLGHPLLGIRLRECCQLLLEIEGRSAYEIFGSPDNIKLRSSVTLFHVAAPEEEAFRNVIAKFFGGKLDDLTMAQFHIGVADEL